jgi:hypothetical protein
MINSEQAGLNVKPTVHYVGEAYHHGIGTSAFLEEVLDHPFLGRTLAVRTSTIVGVDPNGVDFETLNTRYVHVLPPQEEDKSLD